MQTRLGLFVIATLLAGACGDAHDAGDAGGQDVPDIGPGMTRTYAISAMDIEAMFTDASGYGFDLDGRVNGTPGECTDAIDYHSPITGALGVDNQFSNVFPTLDSLLGFDGEEGQIRSAILEGKLAIVIVVGEINSFNDDPAVSVRLVLGEVGTGAMLVPDSTGLALAPGASFHVGTDLGTTTGTITAGQLTFEPSGSLPLFLFPVGEPLPLSHTRFRAHITADALSQGELGGQISMDDIMTWFYAGGATMIMRGDVESVIQPDLEPDAMGVHCAAASTGVEFEAVSATLIEP